MRTWLIKKLGGLPDIDSAIEAIREKESKERYQILTLAVKRLFNTIGPEDILKVHESGQWMFAGKEMSKGQKDMLVSEAKIFIESALWKILQADIQYQANRKMFVQGKDEQDMIAGKLWLYTIDAMNTRLKSMSLGSGLFNHKL